jgi:hypothetical protein
MRQTLVGTCRQFKNARHPDHIPITIRLRSPEVAEHILEAALIMKIANHRAPRLGDKENNRIGYLRKSLTHRERKSIKRKADWRNSPRGRSHMEIQKREEDSTTSWEEWGNLVLEEDEVDINSNEDHNGGQQTTSSTNAPNKSEEELIHAKNELDRQAAEMAELRKWKAQQEAFNQAREERFEQHVKEREKANLLASSQNGNSASPPGDNASHNSTDE